MLIDTFRLRCEDDYTYGAHNHGIYGNDPPLPVFRDFLARAKAAGMLPQWWNEEKEKECEYRQIIALSLAVAVTVALAVAVAIALDNV